MASTGIELHCPAKDRTGADPYLPESTIGQYQRRSKLTRQTSSGWRRKKDTWLYGSQPIAVSTLHLLVNLSPGCGCLLCTSFLSSYPKCLSFPRHAFVQHDLLFALLVLVNNFSFRCFFFINFFLVLLSFVVAELASKHLYNVYNVVYSRTLHICRVMSIVALSILIQQCFEISEAKPMPHCESYFGLS